MLAIPMPKRQLRGVITLSIIIPLFNEQTTIVEIVKKIVAVKLPKIRKEIIVVDDGSPDQSLTLLKTYTQQTKRRITILHNSHNQGKGASVKKGILHSQGQIVLIQDADLEYDPSEYPKLLEPIIAGKADVVFGTRFAGGSAHRVLYFWHYQMNKALTLFSNMLTNLNLTDIECCYKVFRGDLIRKIAPQLKSRRFGFEPEVTARCAKVPEVRIYEIGVSYFGRTYSEGKHIKWHDGVKAIFEIIYFNLLN